MNQQLTDQMFIDANYVEFKPNTKKYNDIIYIETCFQKCITDNIGKKYFITVNKWSSWVHIHTGDIIGPSYEFYGQFSDKVTGKPMNINLFSGWTIEEAEKRFEEIFNMGCWEYYEKYEY